MIRRRPRSALFPYPTLFRSQSGDRAQGSGLAGAVRANQRDDFALLYVHRDAAQRFEALRGISMHVEQGEVVTLIGANGAGKTTTLRTITGLRSEERRVGKECRSRSSPYHS